MSAPERPREDTGVPKLDRKLLRCLAMPTFMVGHVGGRPCDLRTAFCSSDRFPRYNRLA
jgi:hypothetical protein